MEEESGNQSTHWLVSIRGALYFRQKKSCTAGSEFQNFGRACNKSTLSKCLLIGNVVFAVMRDWEGGGAGSARHSIDLNTIICDLRREVVQWKWSFLAKALSGCPACQLLWLCYWMGRCRGFHGSLTKRHGILVAKVVKWDHCKMSGFACVHLCLTRRWNSIYV